MADFGKLNFAVAFNPQTAFPLDARYYFASLADAEAAAQGAVEVGSSTGTYFFGQNIVVVADGVATLYIIQPDKSLKPVGSTPVGDNKSIVVSENGVISIKGADTATLNQQPRINAKGEIEWYSPDTSTVEGLSQTVGQHTTQITQIQTDVSNLETAVESKANAVDVYTKTQTNDKIAAAISSVYKPAGSVAFENLPTPAVGEEGKVYNVTNKFTAGDTFVTGEVGKTYPAGTNVVCIEESDGVYKWDVLSGPVDLSGYLTSEEATKTYATIIALDGKVDKVAGSRLMTDAEGEKLAAIAAGAQVNAIDGVSDEFTIQAEGKILAVQAIEQSKITGLVDALVGKVDKVEGKGLSTNDFTDAEKTKLEGIAAGAQANVLESVAVNGVALPISNKQVNIGIATAQALGVVKSTDVENGVAVAADGTMGVNSVNVSKLVQTAGDTLILNGGNSVTTGA